MITLLQILLTISGALALGFAYFLNKERNKTKKFENLNNIKNDILTFSDQKSQMEKLFNALQLETQIAKGLVNDLQNSKAELDKQLKSLKAELNQTSTKLNTLILQNNEEQQKTQQLLKQRQDAQIELNKLSQEVVKFKTDKEVADKQFKTSKADLMELQNAVSNEKSQKEKLNEELSALNKLIAVKKNSTIIDQLGISLITPEPEPPRRVIKYIGYEPSTQFLQTKLHYYPYVSMPKEKSVIKFPRKIKEGRIGNRGYKEPDFDIYLKRYFCQNEAFQFFNDRFLFISNNTDPYIPDHILIDEKKNLNLFIDIEIDEPYDLISRLATHEIGSNDEARNKYFNDRGWIVIRFSEIQVHRNILGCCKHIAKVIKSINNNFIIPEDLNQATDIFSMSFWYKYQSDRWAKDNHREEYLGILETVNNHRINSKIKTSLLTENEDDILAESKVLKQTLPPPQVVLSINKLNEHPRDKYLQFEPVEHKYTLNGNPNIISGTTFIHKFFNDFDPDEAILKMQNGMNWNEHHKFYNWSNEAIKAEWERNRDEAATLGTELHLEIENYFENSTIINKTEFRYFLSLLSSKLTDLKPYRTEWRIYDDVLMIAGTSDAVFKKKNGTFVIYDWKRSKEIKQTAFGSKKGLRPCNSLIDCNFQHYCLQLNLYKKILEDFYDDKGKPIVVSEMYFVQLHPNFLSYNLYEVPNMQDNINEMYKELITLKY